MRFQVAKQDLEAALQVVTPSLSSSGTDITSHYVFRRTGTKKDGYGVEEVTCSRRTPVRRARSPSRASGSSSGSPTSPRRP